jgi:hypothetical protein
MTMMRGPVLVYPSAFNHGVLTCAKDGNKNMCTLYFENTADTWFLQLDLPVRVFLDTGCRFRVDVLDPADGGNPIMTVCDALKIAGRDLTKTPLSDRQREIADLLFPEGDIFSAGDFRIMKPRLKPAAAIQELMEFDIVNHPGVCTGAAFLDDTYNQHGGPSEGNFVVRRTRYPDVYELFTDGVKPAPGNNVAYVPTMEMSQALRHIFGTRNSVTMPCVYHEKRQKWVPCIPAPTEETSEV